MGRKIRASDCQNGPDKKAANRRILADAFSGHCFAMPCQVRDETYIKVKGKWCYLYRAVDKHAKTLDFMLSKRRDRAAARRFFKRAFDTNGVPNRIVIDKIGANLAGLQQINVGLKLSQTHRLIEILRVKYLNNIVEQPSRRLQAIICRVIDHRFVKKITRPMLGFKVFHSAEATLSGIETAHMIRKQQFQSNHTSPFEQFTNLAT